MSIAYHDLRTFMDLVRAEGELVEINDADWDLEIGTLTEASSEYLDDPPMLLFDDIKGHSKGLRVASLTVGSRKRSALSMGLPLDKTKLELVRLLVRKIQSAEPIPPEEVADGPVMENIMGPGGENEIDIFRFPSLRSHMHDGGRYIGTGDSLINRDPDSGYINVGTYRMQVHDSGLLGLWMSPGQQGRRICQRHWDDGKACPVVAIFGGDPLVFQGSHIKFPWGRSELDYIGGMRGEPLKVIPGPLTGLPIPAYSEVAIEGEVPPPGEEAHEEGPFGEWPGYYTGGTRGTGEEQPVIRIKAIYYRNDPILMNQAPQWPFAPTHGVSQRAGLLWDQLEAAGVANIKGVYCHTAYLVVVAIEQAYAGHAKMAGMAAMNCVAGARNGRYVVVVDEDIDPTNLKEVVWAMQTRVDPASDIQLVDGCWSTPLDPRMPPDKRAIGDHTNSRAIFYAVRPWTWRDKFPMVNRCDRDQMRAVMDKYRGVLPFPEGA
jgi:4-hydroxy-3-polyprenylbenzoate decarboxylase